MSVPVELIVLANFEPYVLPVVFALWGVICVLMYILHIQAVAKRQKREQEEDE